jgi:hypothetical protein
VSHIRTENRLIPSFLNQIRNKIILPLKTETEPSHPTVSLNQTLPRSLEGTQSCLSLAKSMASIAASS